MKDLFTAIYTQFQTTSASSFYSKVAGRLYIGEPPQNTKFPYATYNLVLDVADENWTSKFEEATIDFNLYSDSTAGVLEVTQMYEGLKEGYDNCVLATSDHTMIHCQRENAWLSKYPDLVPNKSIWQYTVQYNILLRSS